MSRFVTTVGRPQSRATEAHVRSENVSTVNITTANGSSITITGSHIELQVENLGPPTNSIRRRQSVSRPNREEAREDAPEDDGQTTVDWTADADLVRQIDADRQRARGVTGPPAAGRTFPVGMPAPATPESIVSRARIASGEIGSNEPKSPSRPSGERYGHNRKSSDPKAGTISQDAAERKVSPSQLEKVAHGSNDDGITRPKRMSSTSGPRKVSGGSDQPRDHREQTHTSGTAQVHRASRMASQSFARPTDPTAPIAIPRSSVASLRDDISTVASLRLGSRFGDPLGDNAPPIVSTPPVRRPSLSHNFHSDPTDHLPRAEIPPRSPSPYEREEVVVQNPQSPPTAQSIHQRLATRPSPSDSTARRKEPPLQTTSDAATTVERVQDTSFCTPLHEPVTANTPVANEPSLDRRIPVPETANVAGSQGSMTAARHQAKASSLTISLNSRLPSQSQSLSSPLSGVQTGLSPGSAHTKAKFVSIFDSVGSKSSTPTSSRSAAAQVAQGVHPPSLLPVDIVRPTETAVVSPSESTSLRGPLPTSSASESVSAPSAGMARQVPKSKDLDLQKSSTASVGMPPAIIPNNIARSHEQKLCSPSTVQEGSVPSGHTASSSLSKLATLPSEVKKVSITDEVLSPLHDLPRVQELASDLPQPPPNAAIPTQHMRPSQLQEEGAPSRPLEQPEVRTEDLPTKSQPMLRLVPMPGYGSNEPSPITFPVTATAANLERQVMQERERILRESSVSHVAMPVPIEYCPPPAHQHPNPLERAQEETTFSSSNSSSQLSGAQKKTHSRDSSSLPAADASRQVPIKSQPTCLSTPSDRPSHQNDKTVAYYKAAQSSRPPAQTTTVEIVSIRNPTHTKTPASRLLDAGAYRDSPRTSSHKPSPAPFVVQHHPQNPWQGMSPISSSNSSVEQQQPGSSLPTPDHSPPPPLPQETEPVPGLSANLLGLFGVEAGHGLNRKPSRLEGGRQGSVGVSTPPDTPRMMAMQSAPAFNPY